MSAAVENGSETTSGYFRRLYTEHPEWLAERSNEAILAQWSADHSGEEPPANLKANLANVKSAMRREQEPKEPAIKEPSAECGATEDRHEYLTDLEERLDDCLVRARASGAVLANVVGLLRQARNEVVRQQS
jgi:hypothetical protein